MYCSIPTENTKNKSKKTNEILSRGIAEENFKKLSIVKRHDKDRIVHANIKIDMNKYTLSISEQKRLIEVFNAHPYKSYKYTHTHEAIIRVVSLADAVLIKIERQRNFRIL